MNDSEPAVPEQGSKRPSTSMASGLEVEIASIIGKAQAEGLQLTGAGGLLPDMIKQAVEAAMNVELTDHLGYERYAVEGRATHATARRR